MAWLIAQPQTNAIARARYVEQARDNALATQLAEIDAIGRIVTDHLDDNQIMWNW